MTSPRPVVGLLALAALLGAGPGCAAFSYQIPNPELGALGPVEGPLFVEPILENAELELRSASHTSGNVTTTTYWKDKPFFAQPHVRRAVYAALLERLRPRRMVGTDALAELPPELPVRLLRTTLAEHREVDNNFTAQYLACGLGLGMVPLCPLSPLALVYNAAVPMRQEQRIRVVVQLFELPRHQLADRLHTPPDSVYPLVDTRGLEPLLQREFEATAVGEQGVVASTLDGFLLSQEEREERLVLPFAAYLEQVIATTAADAPLEAVPAPSSAPGVEGAAGAAEEEVHAF